MTAPAPTSGGLQGRVALVTGGARGIGLAIATRLAEDGARVAILDVDPQLLDAGITALRKTSPDAEAIVADVTSSDDIDAAFAVVETRLGPLDILVNNAGMFLLKDMVDHTEEQYDLVVDTNLKGTFLACRRALPSMIERRRGHVVNIASVAAFNYTVPHAPYAAAKAGVVALTRDLAFEVARHGVRVNAVAPGLIERPQDNITTDGVDETRPLGWGRAEDIANAVWFLVSGHANFVVGATIPVAGGTNLAVSLGFKRDEVTVAPDADAVTPSPSSEPRPEPARVPNSHPDRPA